MSDEVLKLRGVSVRRETSMLLRNVDWTAHENERWIVIGPNGAGKTTLLQVAATSLFPTEGTVRSDDDPALAVVRGPVDVPQQQRRLAPYRHATQLEHLVRHSPLPLLRSSEGSVGSP